MIDNATPTLSRSRKGRPFSRISGLTGLPTGKIAYLHPTKGLRNRVPTPQLLISMMGAAG